MLKLVLWDLDGTLVDPAGAITGSMAKALTEHGFPVPDDATLRKFIGPPLKYSLEHYTEVSDEDYDEIITTYRKHYRSHGIASSKVYPGMRELLYTLKDYGVKQALATQKPRTLAEEVLEEFNLRELFDVVSTAPDALNADGPQNTSDKPWIIRTAISAVEDCVGEHLQEGNAVMIGDRVFDARGAAENNISSIGVSWGFGSTEELTSEFEQVAGSAVELERLIKNTLELTT